MLTLSDLLAAETFARVVLLEASDDAASGGPGNDFLFGGDGSDTLTGGEGDDLFVASVFDNGLSEIVDFQAGDRLAIVADPRPDHLLFPNAIQDPSLEILATNGASTLVEITPAATQLVGSTQVILRGNFSAADLVFDGQMLTLAPGVTNAPSEPAIRTIAGTPEADTLAGTLLPEILAGGAGADTISGGDGDTVRGGDGADTFDIRGGITFIPAALAAITFEAGFFDRFSPFPRPVRIEDLEPGDRIQIAKPDDLLATAASVLGPEGEGPFPVEPDFPISGPGPEEEEPIDFPPAFAPPTFAVTPGPAGISILTVELDFRRFTIELVGEFATEDFDLSLAGDRPILTLRDPEPPATASDDPVLAIGTATHDRLVGGGDAGPAIALAGAGNDTLMMLAAPVGTRNLALAGSGNDTLTVLGSAGLISGGSGNDTFLAASSLGGNRLAGGAGDDTFFLSDIAGDRAFGGAGDDTFTVGAGGGNILVGGAGSDTFALLGPNGWPSAANVIVDFDPSIDRLAVPGLEVADLTFVGSEIRNGDTTIASLPGFDATTLAAANFV